MKQKPENLNNKTEMMPFNKDFVLEIIINDKIIVLDLED